MRRSGIGSPSRSAMPTLCAAPAAQIQQYGPRVRDGVGHAGNAWPSERRRGFHATDPSTMLQRNLPSVSPMLPRRTVTEASPVRAGWPAIRVLIAAAALLALFSVPIFSTVLPPLFDYPNHLARFWILASGGNAFYAVHWAPLPNLAGDLIVPLLPPRAQATP